MSAPGAADGARRLGPQAVPVEDLDAVRAEVAGWFALESLRGLQGLREDPAGRLAQEWLAQDGKRWRPFLVVCAARALAADPHADGADLRRIAVAVECFHKASLIHDDIEDGDDERYGRASMHARVGVAQAINVGDWLVGEGYRLLAELSIDPCRARRILQIAAAGHQQLSVGQGLELDWRRRPGPVSELEVLRLYRDKTAPAFAKAILGGAVFGGADEASLAPLLAYSEQLGMAYQVRDDLQDFRSDTAGGDLRPGRVSLVLSLAHGACNAAGRQELNAWWAGQGDPARIRALVEASGVLDRLAALRDELLARAEASLQGVGSRALAALLRGIIKRIFA